MNRLKTLVIAASLVGAAPLPALAQVWPATVVAGAPAAAPSATAPHSTAAPARGLVVVRHETRAIRRPPGTAPTDPASRTLSLTHAGDVPEVDLRPKAEWSDDQGWRATPTRVAFRHRF
ncbi:MAG: hypothetical protein JNL41_19460 [Phenylobacterium sp.]|uniref:hypothetical protein n=1 Tax=Phenylobacterium sp. TaxID=1871053 RepID=UPI001A386297|nr:hypothetical protein [Phenylobacterium sp.]MBL8556461.1 hypothetical protein [Phenylobacterium sp.]